MTNNPVYIASVFSKEVHYQNLKGVDRNETLTFCLDPMSLMAVITKMVDRIKPSKSKNPSKKEQELDGTQQLVFINELVRSSIGYADDAGESWISDPDMMDTLAARAFMVKLATSDQDRKEFATKVVLNPFDAFVEFAKADAGNSAEDIKQFTSLQKRLHGIFASDDNQTMDQKRAALEAELEQLRNSGDSDGE